MNSHILPSPPPTSYSLEWLQEEARQLVARGAISRQQSIYILCKYIPAREWVSVESELEQSEYLLRDCIGDLIGLETWPND